MKVRHVRLNGGNQLAAVVDEPNGEVRTVAKSDANNKVGVCKCGGDIHDLNPRGQVSWVVCSKCCADHSKN